MKNAFKSNTITTGLAMFSMFFGAGNVVFPLSVGQVAQDQNFWAIMGLAITAVGVPFLGLFSMTLFDGDYHGFFQRIGKRPGFLFATLLMLLIGPFGAMPRTITVSYATLHVYFPALSLGAFSLIACVIIFFLTYKRSALLEILGYVLTPILLLSLFTIIIKGIFDDNQASPSGQGMLEIFSYGLREGYKTMDLLATPFFCSVVILCLKKELHPHGKSNFKQLVKMTLQASCIGAGLLALVYIGFSYVAAFRGETLISVAKENMIGVLAYQMLGNFGGILASVAVSLACLTTAIALAAVFAEFIHEDLFQKKVSYRYALAICVFITFWMTTLSFRGLDLFLGPFLFVIYPTLIMLCCANIAHKLFGVKVVKWPVGITFVGALLFLLMQ